MRIFLPEGASCLANVPPPAPLPMMMTSKCLSMRLQAEAVLHDAAVREHGGRGDVTRAVSREEADDAGNLFGTRHAPQRYRGIQLRELGRIVHSAQVDRRRYRAGAHADHQDVVR